MKKIKKITVIMISLVLLAGILCSCGKPNNKVKTGGTYTYWSSLPSSSSETITSFNEMLYYQELEKRTGIKVEFLHPSKGSTGSESFQILLASGDYPDMIEYSWGSYTGGPEQAINDGILISLNDYLKDYAPNYYDIMEGDKAKNSDYSYKLDAISSNGKYYGFKSLNIGSYSKFDGLYVRKDKLDEWGIDIPTTISEWDNLFKIAKENGIKYPLTISKTTFWVYAPEVFNCAWNVGKSFYVDNDKVKFGPFEKEYIEYLKKMNEWYNAGYIDIDFVTNSTTSVHGAMTNGTSIASFGGIGGDIGKLLPAMAERDPNYNLVACPYPVMNKGDKTLIQTLTTNASDPSIGITVQCGENDENRYKEAITWCDYIYSDEGMILQSFGIEGNTYTIEKDENGEERYVYTDRITDHEKIGAHSVSAALYHFMRPANAPGYAQHNDYLMGYYQYEQQQKALELWNQDADIARDYAFPRAVSYTNDESDKIANIEFNEKQNLESAVSNFIIGKINEKQYIAEINRIKKAGYGELIDINQAAYNRYMSKKIK